MKEIIVNTHSKVKPTKNIGINTKIQKESVTVSRSKLTFIAAALASFSVPSMAQLVVNNTVMHVLDPISVNTGTTVGTAGYALNVTNGGSFIADQGVGLTTGGNTANAIAVSGSGSSALVNGSSFLTTTGNTSHGVYVQSNGQATLDNATITTSGTSSVGMNAVTGGNLTLSNSTINTSGNASQGIVAINAGVVTVTNSNIATTGGYQGNGASGVQIANGTTGSISGSTVSTQGNSSAGIFVETTNSANTNFTVADTKIDTYGSSTGLTASELNGLGSSTATLNGHNIITTHGTGAGISSRGPGGKIIINDGTEVSTLGASSTGIQAITGGHVEMTGTEVKTALDNSYGINSNGSGSSVSGTSVEVTTAGLQSHGVLVNNQAHADLSNSVLTTAGIRAAGGYTQTGADLSLNNVVINTSGAGAYGLNSNGVNSKIDATNVTISTTGARYNGTFGALGAVAEEGGELNIHGNSIISTTQDYANGVLAQNTTLNAQTSITIDGSTTITTLGNFARGMWSKGVDSKIVSTGTTINTNGTSSSGVYTSDTGKIEFTDGHVSTAGTSAYGAYAESASSITTSGSTFATSGASAHGIYVTTGSEAILNGSNNVVTTSGAGAYGMNVTGANSKLVTNGSVQINTTGSNGIGVYAAGLGQVDLGNGSVIKTSTNGAHTNAYGLYANGSSGVSKITASNVTVETGSSVGHGIYAANAGGEIYINGANNKVTTTGEGAYGLIASRTGSQIIISDKIEITTTGAKSNGVSVSNQGGVGSVLIDLGTGSVVNTNNLGAKGLVSNYLGSLLKGRDVSVNTGTGADSYGAYVLDQAALQLTGGQIVTAGSNAHGVYATGNGTAVTLDNTQISVTGSGAHAIMSNAGAETTITQKNNILSSTQGTTLYSEGGLIEANLDGSLIQNNGMLIDAKIDANSGLFSRIDLNAKNLSMTGDIQAESSSIANLNLSNATWTGKATNATDFELDGSSVWNMTASSDVANLNHAGQINFAEPTGNSFSTLTVRSDYTGNDGTIALHTKLDSDGAPSDQLIVTGGTSGSSKLHITNIGGIGALTVADGIQVVDVAGASNGTFGLANRVTAGLYEYDLFQNGVDANAADGNWYLRSLKLPDGTPVVPTEPTVYLRNLSAASGMFMHTLHDRLGEPQFTDTYKTDDRNPSSVWVRVVGNHTESKGGNGQIDLDTDTSLVHIGGDIARWTNDNNDRLNIGLMGAYGHSKIDASANQMPTTASGISRNATGKIDGYSIGAYATWYGNQDKPAGAYVDTWAQYGWYDNKVQGNAQREESYNSTGWTASVEVGYALIARDTDNRQLMIEPQVQLAYNSYKADDYTDQNGTRITDSDANGVITRVGARLYSRSKLNDNGVQPFIEANWWYSDAKNTLAFNGETMSDGTPSSRYELKAGLQGEVAKNWLMWGHIGGQWGENSYNRYEGMVGIKRMF